MVTTMKADASAEYREQLAERLSQECALKGVTAAELARRIGVTKSTTADWLAGRTTIPAWGLLASAEALRVPLTRLRP
jgi:transcriptional regulator with XRE-family HTH domain